MHSLSLLPPPPPPPPLRGGGGHGNLGEKGGTRGGGGTLLSLATGPCEGIDLKQAAVFTANQAVGVEDIVQSLGQPHASQCELCEKKIELSNRSLAWITFINRHHPRLSVPSPGPKQNGAEW